MATTSSNGGSELGTPAKTICDFRKGLKEELAASKGEQVASTSKIAGWETARGYKLCTLAETEKTFGYYRDLDNYELFDIQQSAGIIADNVAKYIKWDDDLTKLIKEGSKGLNDLKTKMLAANNASCAMRNCLQSIIGFGDNDVPPELKAVTDSAKSLSEDSQKAADAMVTIAGIHTFADLKALKQFVQDLPAAVKDLKTVTDGYIKTAGDDLQKTQKDLTKVIDELNTEMFVSAEAQSAVNGLNEAISFICNRKCLSVDDLEDICKKVSNVEDGEGNGGQAARPKYAREDED